MIDLKGLEKFTELKVEEVFVEEWNDTIGIKVLSGLRRGKFENEMTKCYDNKGNAKDISGLRFSLLKQCLVNSKHELMINDVASMKMLQDQKGTIIEMLFKKAMEINELNKDSLEKKKDN